MYTEEKNEFPIKDLLIKILFLAIFVFLLLWLFPIGRSRVDLKPLTDRVFIENIHDMKEVAKSYYTNERLPKMAGDKVSMTLQTMHDRKLLIPFTDSKGKLCDAQDSYVEVTKMDKEFTLKVYLSCGKQADYIIEVMGCNDKCKIFEDKVADNEPVKPSTPSKSNNKPVKPSKPSTPSKPTPPEKKPTNVNEYEYKRTIASSTWSNYAAWTDQYKTETDSLKRKERTLVQGVKTISESIYKYRHYKTQLSDWSAPGNWTTELQTTNTYKKIADTRTTTKTVWLDTFGPYGEWSAWVKAGEDNTQYDMYYYNIQTEKKEVAGSTVYGNWTYQKNIETTNVYAQYPSGTNSSNATTRYTLVDYDTRLACSSGCYNYVTYYIYKVETRTKTTTPSTVYWRYRVSKRDSRTETITEYRYSTRKNETIYTWSNSSYLYGWTYDNYYYYDGENTSYVYTDWLEKLPSGYSLYNTKKQYAYSTKTTTYSDEYTWSTNTSLTGWTKTGKVRTKTVVM